MNVAPDNSFRLNVARIRDLMIKAAPYAGFGVGKGNRVRFLRRLCAHPEPLIRREAPIRKPTALVPVWDHPVALTRDGKPAYLVFHTYTQLTSDVLLTMTQWCRQVGLEISIDSTSDYFPSMALRVVLRRVGTPPLPRIEPGDLDKVARRVRRRKSWPWEGSTPTSSLTEHASTVRK